MPTLHHPFDVGHDEFYKAHVNDERYVCRTERAAADAGDWHRSLRRANGRRRGRPYVLPPEMLEFVRRMITELRLSYRAAEGHLRRMLSALGMKVLNHATIRNCLHEAKAVLTVPPMLPDYGVIAAVDISFFSTTLRGKRMRDHRHKHRGFVKAHVAVDVMMLEVLAVVITDDAVGENRMFSSLIEHLLGQGIAIDEVLANGAYAMRENFDLHNAHDIAADIDLDDNAATKSRGHTSARPNAFRERNELGHKGWEDWYEYSLRWIILYVFSAVKRTLG